MQLWQQGILLVVMLSHSTQDVVEYDDRFVDVGSLVQHDAFSPLAHRRVADLGPRRQPALRELLEYLRRPYHRQMRGLT